MMYNAEQRARFAQSFWDSAIEGRHLSSIVELDILLQRAQRDAIVAAAKVARCSCADICGEEPGRPLCNNELANRIEALLPGDRA